ncbi:hypothetical protein WT24_25795 [Burkholderia sp. MSMB1078WGS]|nr:hypothetical protein WS61_15530 [Burkholderia sp. ABCPW 11]KVT03815.1 hypothetical protein WT24_25795 [Burkholderia sp. MSMB1078WGS]
MPLAKAILYRIAWNSPAGMFVAIRFWHMLITRIVAVIVGLDIAVTVAYSIALTTVQCLGSCD